MLLLSLSAVSVLLLITGQAWRPCYLGAESSLLYCTCLQRVGPLPSPCTAAWLRHSAADCHSTELGTLEQVQQPGPTSTSSHQLGRSETRYQLRTLCCRPSAQARQLRPLYPCPSSQYAVPLYLKVISTGELGGMRQLSGRPNRQPSPTVP